MKEGTPSFEEWLERAKESGESFALSPIYNDIADNVILTPEVIAEMIGIKSATVREWVRVGKLKSLNPGGHHKIRGIDLKRFLFAREWKKINTTL